MSKLTWNIVLVCQVNVTMLYNKPYKQKLTYSSLFLIIVTVRDGSNKVVT